MEWCVLATVSACICSDIRIIDKIVIYISLCWLVNGLKFLVEGSSTLFHRIRSIVIRLKSLLVCRNRIIKILMKSTTSRELLSQFSTCSVQYGPNKARISKAQYRPSKASVKNVQYGPSMAKGKRVKMDLGGQD